MKIFLIFDFDGVIIDSIAAKGNAFSYLFRDYGSKTMIEVNEYHKNNGGMPREKKIENIFKYILKKNPRKDIIEEYCKHFSEIVVDSVIKCKFLPGSFEFISNKCNKYKQFIVSATPQKELEFIVKEKLIKDYFYGVFGSPKNKDIHIKNIIINHSSDYNNAVYIGDSLSDSHYAHKAGIDFIGYKSDDVKFPQKEVIINNLLELEGKII